MRLRRGSRTEDKHRFLGGCGIGKAISVEPAREGVDVVAASRNISKLELRSESYIEDITDPTMIPTALGVAPRERAGQATADADGKS